MPTPARSAPSTRPPTTQPPVEKRVPRPADVPSQKTGRRRIFFVVGVAGLLALAVVVIVWQVTKQRGGETPTVAAGGDPPVVGANTAKAEQPAAKSNDPNEPVEGPEGGAPVVRPTPPGKTGPSFSPDDGTVRRVDDDCRWLAHRVGGTVRTRGNVHGDSGNNRAAPRRGVALPRLASAATNR